MPRAAVLVLLISVACAPIASAGMFDQYAVSPAGWLGSLRSAFDWLVSWSFHPKQDGLVLPGGESVVPDSEPLRNLSGAMIIPSGSPAPPPAPSDRPDA